MFPAFKGETDHPRSFEHCSFGRKNSDGRNGKIFLSGDVSLLPTLEIGILKVFPAARTSADTRWITWCVLCLMAACVSEQAPRAEKLLWDSVQPVPWESVRQDTRRRDSWKGKKHSEQSKEKKSNWKDISPLLFQEQKIAVLRKLFSS